MHNLWLSLVIVGLILPAAACGGEGAPATGPKPFAVLTGPIEIREKASSGTITLTVSKDGASITSVNVTLTDFECSPPWASYILETRDVSPVAEGNIVVSLSGLGEIKGRFTSPTEASGTIDLAALGRTFAAGTCELGKSNWSAKAD